MIRKVLAILLLSSLGAVGGCQIPMFFFYLFAPNEDSAKKMESDYKGPSLEKHSLAVVVYTDLKVRYAYPQAPEYVGRAISSRFQYDEVKEVLKDVRIIDPGAVLNYQERNIHWDEMDKTQLGKALGADFVLMVSLVEFSTRQPMSVNLLQGMATAEVSLYKTDLPERQCRVYHGEDVRVVYPKNASGGVPGYDDTRIREETVRQLAQKVVWRFYKHEEPVEK
jgi:hypothetical protein